MCVLNCTYIDEREVLHFNLCLTFPFLSSTVLRISWPMMILTTHQISVAVESHGDHTKEILPSATLRGKMGKAEE